MYRTLCEVYKRRFITTSVGFRSRSRNSGLDYATLFRYACTFISGSTASSSSIIQEVNSALGGIEVITRYSYYISIEDGDGVGQHLTEAMLWGNICLPDVYHVHQEVLHEVILTDSVSAITETKYIGGLFTK